MGRDIKCPYCGKESSSEKGLVIHARQKHDKSSEELFLSYKLNGVRPLCKCGCGQQTEFSRWSTGFKKYIDYTHRAKHRKEATHRTKSCEHPSCDNSFEAANYEDKKYCSSKCAANHIDVQEKRKDTVRQKYGVSNISQVKEVRRKAEETTKNKYGVSYALQNPDILKKKQETNIEKYGKPNTFQVEQFKNKAIQSHLEKYGTDHHTKSDKYKKERKDREFSKYGKYYVQTKDFQDKTRATNLERYGVEHSSQSKEVSIKISNAHLEKSYKNLQDIEEVTPLFLFKDFNGVKKHRYLVECNTCGSSVLGSYDCGRVPRCLNCHPLKAGESMAEQQVQNYVKSLYENMELRDRGVLDGKELDIFIPEKNIAIEYNGMYWHSDDFKDKYYHIDKTQQCHEHGIHLVHIFSDEWKHKKDIVKSRLKNLLISTGSVYARKCEIKNISYQEKNEFLNKHHIQGADISSVYVGLFYEKNLVAVMTFSKPRISLGQNPDKKGTWELSRYCSEGRVVGGASKLFSHFKKEHDPESVYTYADIRWSGLNPSLYTKLGFSFSHQTKPNYWYAKKRGSVRHHRFGFRKSVLKDKLELFNPSLTEYQNMKRNGYIRIWDCGNLKYEWNKKGS